MLRQRTARSSSSASLSFAQQGVLFLQQSHLRRWVLLHRRLLLVFCYTLYPLAVLIRIFLLMVHNGIGAIWTVSAMSEGISLPALLTLMFALGAIGLLMSLGRRMQQEQAIVYSLQHTLAGHGGAVRDVAWSPDGRVLASCSR